jgi:DNA-binding beta-propeller fold protein YncE
MLNVLTDSKLSRRAYRRGPTLLLALALLVFAALLAVPASSRAAPPLGSITQLESPFNCVSEEGYEQKLKEEGHEVVIGCGTLVSPEAMNETYEAQVSPDGKDVYSVAVFGALVEYSRNSANGALTPIGCVTSASEPCASKEATTKAPGMANPVAIALSPDGQSAYVVTKGGNAVVEFSRNEETGLLSEIGCVEEAGAECAMHEAKGIGNPYDVTVSPDGKDVYVTSFGKEAVAEFSRDPATGLLTQLASPDNCISTLTTAETGCGTEKALGLEQPIGMVSSSDGNDVYVASGGTEGPDSSGAIVALGRESNGALKQLEGDNGCISTSNTKCAPGVSIDGPEDLLVSPDGKNVYVNSSLDNAVIELNRNSSTGVLTQLEAPNGCLTTKTEPLTETCSLAKGIEHALGVAISPGGEDVYVNSSSEDDEAVFTRDAETGVLTPLPAPYECAGKVEKSTCGATNIEGIAGARRTTVSPDGKNLYVAGQNDHAIVELARTVPSSVELPVEPVSGAGPLATSIPSAIIPPAIVPPPVLAKTGNLAPVSGTVLVKLPGTSRFVPLSSLEQIPFGSTIEATHGTVSVTTAEPGGKTQTGEFFEGEFILRQGANGIVIAELTGGNFSVCPTKRERSHIARAGFLSSIGAASFSARAASASGSHVVRKLWANAHGKFSTKGNYAAGAVQGTEWLTEDLCDGTYIKVTRDKVAVTNLVNHRHVEVTTGHHYLAKAP